MTHAIHGGLADYLRQQGVEQGERYQDGSVALVFDGRFRVLCRPIAGGELLLESRLGDLPALPRERTALIRRLLETLGEALMLRLETISLSPEGNRLMLQQRMPADASRALFETMLERHVNAVSSWRGMMGVM